MIISLFLLLFAFLFSSLVPSSSRKVFLVCLLSRLSISLLNIVSEGNFIGASVDANSFYLKSISNVNSIANLDWSKVFNDGVSFFVNINSILQFLNGEPSFFLAHMLSILISSLCMVLLVKTYFLFPHATLNGSNTLLLLYSFTPSTLTYQSFILREASQSLCVLCMIYVPLRFVFRGFSLYWFLLWSLSFFCGIMLHSVMPVIIFIIAIIGVYISLSSKFNNALASVSMSRVLSSSLLISVLAIFITLIGLSSSTFNAFTSGDALSNADSYLNASIIDGSEARAQYGKIFSLQNPFSILPSFLVFMLAPIGLSFSPQDLIIGAENFIKFTFFIAYLNHRKHLPRVSRNLLNKMILAWLLVNLIWSFGTTNWGTASRHQVIAYSFLLIPFVLSRTASKSHLGTTGLSNFIVPLR